MTYMTVTISFDFKLYSCHDQPLNDDSDSVPAGLMGAGRKLI